MLFFIPHNFYSVNNKNISITTKIFLDVRDHAQYTYRYLFYITEVCTTFMNLFDCFKLFCKRYARMICSFDNQSLIFLPKNS